jgi:hypothetical protein
MLLEAFTPQIFDVCTAVSYHKIRTRAWGRIALADLIFDAQHLEASDAHPATNHIATVLIRGSANKFHVNVVHRQGISESQGAASLAKGMAAHDLA